MKKILESRKIQRNMIKLLFLICLMNPVQPRRSNLETINDVSDNTLEDFQRDVTEDMAVIGHLKVTKQPIQDSRNSSNVNKTLVIREKRQIAGVLVGTSMIFGSAVFGLNKANENSDGCVFFPSICENKKYIEKMKPIIITKKITLEKKYQEMFNMFGIYTKTVIHFNIWVGIVQKVFASKTMPQLIFSDLEVTKEDESLLDTALEEVSVSYGKGTLSFIIGSHIVTSSQQSYAWYKVISPQFNKWKLAWAWASDMSQGKIAVRMTVMKNAFKGFGKTSGVLAVVSMILDTAALVVNIVAAEEKMRKYEERANACTKSEAGIDTAIHEVENHIMAMKEQLDLIEKETNRMLGILGEQDSRFSKCTTSLFTIDYDMEELAKNWKNVEPSFDEVLRTDVRYRKILKKVTRRVDKGDSTEEIFEDYSGVISDNLIVAALKKAGATFPAFKWSPWVLGDCSIIPGKCLGMLNMTRTCISGTCLGSTTEMKSCRSKDSACNLPLILQKCTAPVQKEKIENVQSEKIVQWGDAKTAGVANSNSAKFATWEFLSTNETTFVYIQNAQTKNGQKGFLSCNDKWFKGESPAYIIDNLEDFYQNNPVWIIQRDQAQETSIIKNLSTKRYLTQVGSKLLCSDANMDRWKIVNSN